MPRPVALRLVQPSCEPGTRKPGTAKGTGLADLHGDFDYFRRGEPFRTLPARLARTETDYFRRGEPFEVTGKATLLLAAASVALTAGVGTASGARRGCHDLDGGGRGERRQCRGRQRDGSSLWRRLDLAGTDG